MVAIPQDHTFFCGVAIGYRDPGAPVNQFSVARAPLDEAVRWKLHPELLSASDRFSEVPSRLRRALARAIVAGRLDQTTALENPIVREFARGLEDRDYLERHPLGHVGAVIIRSRLGSSPRSNISARRPCCPDL